MKKLLTLLTLICISFNANSNADYEIVEELIEVPIEVTFCREFRDEIELVMLDFNSKKFANNDIHEEIKRKSELKDEFLDEDFLKTKEYKKLIKKWKENDDYIRGTLIPMLETRANIYNGFCKDVDINEGLNFGFTAN